MFAIIIIIIIITIIITFFFISLRICLPKCARASNVLILSHGCNRITYAELPQTSRGQAFTRSGTDH